MILESITASVETPLEIIFQNILKYLLQVIHVYVSLMSLSTKSFGA